MQRWEIAVLVILVLLVAAALNLALSAPAPLPRRQGCEKWLDGWPRVYRTAERGSSVTLHQGGRIEFESVPGQTMRGTWAAAGEGIEWDACAWGPGWHLRWRSSFDLATPRRLVSPSGVEYQRSRPAR